MKLLIHTVIQVAALVEIEVHDGGELISAHVGTKLETSYPSCVIARNASAMSNDDMNIVRSYAARALLGKVLSDLSEQARGTDNLIAVVKDSEAPSDDEDLN
jgi:hypothetical protein